MVTKKKQSEVEVIENDDSDDYAACLYFNDLFIRSKANERLIKCCACQKLSCAELSSLLKFSKEIFM